MLIGLSLPQMARRSDWLDQQETALKIPARAALAVRPCLEEVVGNLIKHAAPNATRLNVAVELDWQDSDMVVSVEDHGAPFDPRDVAAPPRPADLQDAEPGDLGIPLIRSFASGIDYAVLANINGLTLRFRQAARNGTALGQV